MSFESDLFTWLLADTDIAAKVSTRIYPLVKPQDGALPCLRVSLTANESEIHLGGPAGFATDDIQIDCYANTFPETVAIAEVVRKSLIGTNNGFRTMGTTRLTQVRLTSKSDEPPFREDGGGNYQIFNRSLDFEFDYDEPIPS